jgi:hypothetical protein
MRKTFSTYGGEMRKVFWWGKPEGIRKLGKSRCRWEDNIKIDFSRSRMWGMDWLHLDEDRERWWALVNVLTNLWVP